MTIWCIALAECDAPQDCSARRHRCIALCECNVPSFTRPYCNAVLLLVERRITVNTFHDTLQTNHTHAIVIGGGIAGLLATRVLSDFFTRVTVIERDPQIDMPAPCRGTPQSHQFHLLLTKGREIIDGYFPGIVEAMVAGAILQDMAETGVWHYFGSYKKARGGFHA